MALSIQPSSICTESGESLQFASRDSMALILDVLKMLDALWPNKQVFTSSQEVRQTNPSSSAHHLTAPSARHLHATNPLESRSHSTLRFCPTLRNPRGNLQRANERIHKCCLWDPSQSTPQWRCQHRHVADRTAEQGAQDGHIRPMSASHSVRSSRLTSLPPCQGRRKLRLRQGRSASKGARVRAHCGQPRTSCRRPICTCPGRTSCPVGRWAGIPRQVHTRVGAHGACGPHGHGARPCGPCTLWTPWAIHAPHRPCDLVEPSTHGRFGAKSGQTRSTPANIWCRRRATCGRNWAESVHIWCRSRAKLGRAWSTSADSGPNLAEISRCVGPISAEIGSSLVQLDPKLEESYPNLGQI